MASLLGTTTSGYIVLTLTIPASGTVSTSGLINGYTLVGLDVPDLNPTVITLQGSLDGVTYRPLDPALIKPPLWSLHPLAANVTLGGFLVFSADLQCLQGLYSLKIGIENPNPIAKAFKLKLL